MRFRLVCTETYFAYDKPAMEPRPWEGRPKGVC